MTSRSRKHHVLPRFLQDGFAYRRRRSETYVFLFRPGVPVVLVNTRNASVERYYHGRVAGVATEAGLSRYETRYARLIRELPSSGLDNVDFEELDGYVAHLLLRSRAARYHQEEMVRRLVAALHQGMSGATVRTHGETFPDAIKAVTGEVFESPGKMSRESIRSLIDRRLSPHITEQLKQSALDSLEGLRIREFVSEYAGKVLLENIEVRDSKDARSWRLVRAKRPLVLGEVAVMKATRHESELVPVIMPGTTADVIATPLSTACLLVGSRRGHRCEIRADSWNAASARWSRYFLAGSRDPVLEKLASTIGSRAKEIEAWEVFPLEIWHLARKAGRRMIEQIAKAPSEDDSSTRRE